MPGVLALAAAKVLNAVVVGRGHPTYPMVMSIVLAPLTVGLYLLLIPPLEATGAALASSGSYAISALASLLIFRHLTRIRLRRLVPGRADLTDYALALRALREGWLSRRGPRSAPR
jgi:Na+-driven multidrug efflux pump